MKLIKAFGLAAVVAVVATAFIGATSAQAADTIVRCSKPDTLCTAAHTVGGTLNLTATASNPELLGGPLPEKCTSSTTTASATSEKMFENEWAGTINTLTFTGCSPCTSVTSPGNFAARITMNEAGEYILLSTGEATISGGFFCFGNKCRFRGKDIELTIEDNGGHPIAFANHEPLELVEGSKSFCGETGEWLAKYTTTSPSEEFWLRLGVLP